MTQEHKHDDPPNRGPMNDAWIGPFYYNPRDPELWVEKRYGIGWTLNFARSASWFILGAILIPALVTPLLAVRTMVLLRHLRHH